MSCGTNSARTWARMFFLCLSSSSANFSWVSFTDVGWLFFKGVTHAHRNWHMRVFYRERGRQLLPMVFSPYASKSSITFCFGPRRFCPYFSNFACPCLNNLVAGLFQVSRTFLCGFVPIFAYLVVAANNFVTIVRETFSAPMPVAATVWKIQSSLHGCTRPQVHAQPNVRHHARTLRGECGFSSTWLRYQATKAILEKRNVLDRKPSQNLSAVLPPFHLGNLLLSSFPHTFWYGAASCKLL